MFILQFDASILLSAYSGPARSILVDQGTEDNFLKQGQLKVKMIIIISATKYFVALFWFLLNSSLHYELSGAERVCFESSGHMNVVFFAQLTPCFCSHRSIPPPPLR